MMKFRRPALAMAAGIVTAGSLPPWGWWPLAPIGVALFLWQFEANDTYRRRAAHAWWYWMGVYIVGLSWMVDLTVPGWLIAMPVEALIMAAPWALVGPRRRLATVPSALVIGEAIRWVLPFGGVPMTNLALTQVNSPWLHVARVSGALGLIALVGLLAVALDAARRRSTLEVTAGISIVLGAIVIGLFAPSGHTDLTITAAVVQAGGSLGTNAVNSDEAAVFDRHVAAMDLIDQPVDLVVWSESSAVANAPLETSGRMDELENLADRFNATIIANFSEREGQSFRNAAVAVAPSEGLTDRYDKVHLVPFGEYVPLRSFIENFVDLSLIPREALAGTGPGVLETPLGPVATVISFEVYFPERVRSGVQADGRIIANPTLASSYTTTMVPEQSLASARLRAVESARWVLQASTTGYAAIVDSDGRVIGRTGLRDRSVVAAEVELRSGTTWSITLGKWPITLLALLCLVVPTMAAAVRSRRD
jgi:apolipoprotein N-acyltransferase